MRTLLFTFIRRTYLGLSCGIASVALGLAALVACSELAPRASGEQIWGYFCYIDITYDVCKRHDECSPGSYYCEYPLRDRSCVEGHPLFHCCFTDWESDCGRRFDCTTHMTSGLHCLMVGCDECW